MTPSQQFSYYPGRLIGVPEKYIVKNASVILNETEASIRIDFGQVTIQDGDFEGSYLVLTALQNFGSFGAIGLDQIIPVNQKGSVAYSVSETDIVVSYSNWNPISGVVLQDQIFEHQNQSIIQNLRTVSSAVNLVSQHYNSLNNASVDIASRMYYSVTPILSMLGRLLSTKLASYNLGVLQSVAVVSAEPLQMHEINANSILPKAPVAVASTSSQPIENGTIVLPRKSVGTLSPDQSFTVCSSHTLGASSSDESSSVLIFGTASTYNEVGYSPAIDYVYFNAELTVQVVGDAGFDSPSGLTIDTSTYQLDVGVGTMKQTISNGNVVWSMAGEASWLVYVFTYSWYPSGDNGVTPTVWANVGGYDSQQSSLGVCVLASSVTASDPQDPYVRYWAFYVNQVPPSGAWWKEQPQPAYMTTEYSGATAGFTISESPNNLYTVYFIVSQNGRPSYGTYCGTLTVQRSSLSCGLWYDYGGPVDASHYIHYGLFGV